MEVKTCAVDRHPMRREIIKMLNEGHGALAVEREMKAQGHPIKRETIGKHIEVCMGGKASIPHAAAVAAAVTKAEAGAPAAEVEGDFAAAVQKEALRQLEAGSLRITTKDGLVAQKLLDERQARAKDRAFVLDLARLISGAGAPPPDEIVDGDYVDLGEGNLLAPPEMRDGE